ncbi:IS1 family transposase [bacterium]|nr:IS1 family transposase [bacterium]
MESRPLGHLRLDMAKAEMVLAMLLEGMAINAVVRLTGVSKGAILNLIELVGPRCASLLKERIHHQPVKDVQVDEMWGFVQCKDRTRERLKKGEEVGDAWCFTAIERHSKLLLCYRVGKRGSTDTWEFIDDLREATTGRFQLTTDGFTAYTSSVPLVFGFDVDFAQMVKKFYSPKERYTHKRYSPSAITGIDVTQGCGTPDRDRVCTSHVERGNLSIRMHVRRLTRLTNAFSKKWENHDSMLAIFFAWYNWCRKHMTLKTTPAVAAGLTDHVWSVRELLAEAAGCC